MHGYNNDCLLPMTVTYTDIFIPTCIMQMHACMHAFIHTYIHTHIHTYMYTHTHTYTQFSNMGIDMWIYGLWRYILDLICGYGSWRYILDLICGYGSWRYILDLICGYGSWRDQICLRRGNSPEMIVDSSWNEALGYRGSHRPATEEMQRWKPTHIHYI